MLNRTLGPRWAHTTAGIMREVWGDNCDRLKITPATCIKAQDLFFDYQRKFEKTQIEAFRWMKGLVWDQMEWNADAEERTRQFWALETEAEGLGLNEDFHDSYPKTINTEKNTNENDN
jgi:hypothetical protein